MKIKKVWEDIKVIVDKDNGFYLDERYEEVRKNLTLKGFRPEKLLEKFLKDNLVAIMGEVLDKVLKDTSTKALQDNKIRPATQPKIDLKNIVRAKI